MKILFLDVDGVMNCSGTVNLSKEGFIGFDPYMVLLVHRICEATGAKIVVSSTWRNHEISLNEVKDAITPHFLDVTPDLRDLGKRGREINSWLSEHPEVERFAILDDNNWMLPEQQDNFFKTSWPIGLTDNIANQVIEHLNNEENEPLDKSMAGETDTCLTFAEDELSPVTESSMDEERNEAPVEENSGAAASEEEKEADDTCADGEEEKDESDDEEEKDESDDEEEKDESDEDKE